jgi:hypothetical protein
MLQRGAVSMQLSNYVSALLTTPEEADAPLVSPSLSATVARRDALRIAEFMGLTEEERDSDVLAGALSPDSAAMMQLIKETT